MTEQEKEKAAFFEQYASVANEKTLEKIWQAKLYQVTFLDLKGEKSLKDLSPLTNLTALKVLDINNTQVSDLSPLKGLIEKEIEVRCEDYNYMNGIYIKDTPLSNPPIAIAQQGNKAILRYWKVQEWLNFTHS